LSVTVFFLYEYSDIVKFNNYKQMKKRVFLISIILLNLILAKAAYFEKLPYTITQPDGKIIDCFVTGDEYFNWIHDSNGYTIIQAPDGYYYYGEQNGDVVQPSKYLVNSVDPASVGLNKWIKISKTEYERRRSGMLSYQTSISGPGYAPHSGSMNNLAIYIRFSDETEFTITRQVYDDKLNPVTGVALKSYFKEVSYNNLTISSTHYPACALTTNLSYQDSHPRSYFQPYNATTNPNGYTESNKTSREHQLLVDAINWINVNSPVSPSLNIDGDGDGNVDNVCFIIRGSSGGWAELLWAHRWSLYTQTVNINGKRVYGYTFQPENQVDVTTLCHEMFHALGSPDLYHYYTSTEIYPVWYWDLMEAGSGHMLTYMKWKYSNYTWITTIPQITTTGTYTLNPVTSSTNNCYKIASPYSTDEYFMVEYRNKSGTFETNVPGSGLIVYRIDTRNTGNANGPPDEVYVYRPNGTPSANGTPSNAFYSSTVGRTAINDATNPNSFLQNGSGGGLNISNVTTAGATISFNVTIPVPCTPPTTQASAFTTSAITNTTMTAGWTRGNGNSVLVVASKGNAVSASPVNGNTYTANPAFGSGTQLGTGNYVVYNGTGNSVNITNLSEGSGYYFAIYEYSGTYCYKTPALTGNATTIGYCAAGSTSTIFEYISNVAIGSINNPSVRGTAGYQNFTSLSTSLTIGVNATATITVASSYSTDQILIWVDWNKDGDFTDAGENVYSSSGTFTSPHTTSNLLHLQEQLLEQPE
jgi:M6 family metalloprotease-like protein